MRVRPVSGWLHNWCNIVRPGGWGGILLPVAHLVRFEGSCHVMGRLEVVIRLELGVSGELALLIIASIQALVVVI